MDNFVRTILDGIIHPLTYAWNHPSILDEIKTRVFLFKPEVCYDITPSATQLSLHFNILYFIIGLSCTLQLDHISTHLCTGARLGQRLRGSQTGSSSRSNHS
jgi:hypothetical protein